MSFCSTSSLALKSDDNNVIIQVQNHLHVKLAAHLQQSNITRSRGTTVISRGIYAIALVLIEAIILLHDIMPLAKCIKFEYMYLAYSLYNVTVPHQGSDSGVK